MLLRMVEQVYETRPRAAINKRSTYCGGHRIADANGAGLENIFRAQVSDILRNYIKLKTALPEGANMKIQKLGILFYLSKYPRHFGKHLC